VSQSAPLAPQAWPGGPKSYQNEFTGCQNTNPGSSKWRPRVSKCSPRARKYVPKCTFFQKVSQSAPLGPQAWTGAPKSYQNEAHGCQNTAAGSSKWRPRALGARKYVSKITRRKIKSHRPKSRSPPSISKPLHRSYGEPSNCGPPGCWS
jgi:hypothetical protein